MIEIKVFDNDKINVNSNNNEVKKKKLLKSQHFPAFLIMGWDKNFSNNIEHRTKKWIKNNLQSYGLYIYNMSKYSIDICAL